MEIGAILYCLTLSRKGAKKKPYEPTEFNQRHAQRRIYTSPILFTKFALLRVLRAFA